MRIVNILLIAAGFVAVGLGTIGVFLPILPTTPFLLLAAFCFAKGSPRFHKWFVGTRLYKRFLEDFVNTRAMTMRAKLSVCIPVSVIIAVVIITVPSWIARGGIIALLLFKWYYFLFRIKTVSTNKVKILKPKSLKSKY